MIDIKTKNMKKIFGNIALNKVNKEKKEVPIFLLIKNSIKKGYNSTKNIKYKRFFSQKSLNINENNIKSILLKSLDSFNKKIIKSKGNNKINFNETNEINFSDITNFSTSEKNKIKKQFRFKSPNPRPSRNINSESQNNNNNNIMQDFNFFTKKNSQIRQAHLKNNILKLNKMKNNMKTRTETAKNILSIKYIKDSAKITPSKKLNKMHNNFKERLIKSAEIIFKDEEYDY